MLTDVEPVVLEDRGLIWVYLGLVVVGVQGYLQNLAPGDGKHGIGLISTAR